MALVPLSSSALLADLSRHFAVSNTFLEPIYEEDNLLADIPSTSKWYVDYNVGMKENLRSHANSKCTRRSQRHVKQSSIFSQGCRSKAWSKVAASAANEALLREMEAAIPKVQAINAFPRPTCSINDLMKELDSARQLPIADTDKQENQSKSDTVSSVSFEMTDHIAEALPKNSDIPLPLRSSVKQVDFTGRQPVTSPTSECRVMASEGTTNMIEPKTSGLFQFRYSEQTPGLDGLATLHVAMGGKASFAVEIEDMSAMDKDFLRHIRFSAKPALPEGLLIDERTGFISGTPVSSQESKSMHTISGSIEATSTSGFRLGMVPVAACPVLVDIQGF